MANPAPWGDGPWTISTASSTQVAASPAYSGQRRRSSSRGEPAASATS